MVSFALGIEYIVFVILILYVIRWIPLEGPTFASCIRTMSAILRLASYLSYDTGKKLRQKHHQKSK